MAFSFFSSHKKTQDAQSGSDSVMRPATDPFVDPFLPNLIPKNPALKPVQSPKPESKFNTFLFFSFLICFVCAWVALHSTWYFSVDQEAKAVLFLQKYLTKSDIFVKILQFFSDYTNIVTYSALALFVYWCIDWGGGVRMALVGFFSVGLNQTLKTTFKQPRPYKIESGVRRLISSSGFGMPSGHAHETSAVFGVLAEKVNKGWVWATVVFIVIMVGISRVVLGAHLPMQVVAAWFVSAATILFVLFIEPFIIPWFSQKKYGWKVTVLFLFSWFFLGVVYYMWQRLTPIAEWPHRFFYSSEFRYDFYIQCGALWGWLCGAAYCYQFLGQEIGVQWWRRVIRYIIGILIIGILYLSVSYISDVHIAPLSFLLGLIVGILIGGAFPTLFKKYF